MKIRIGFGSLIVLGFLSIRAAIAQSPAGVMWDVAQSPTEVINTGRAEVLGSITLFAHDTGTTGTATGGDSQIALIYDQPSLQISNTTSSGIRLFTSINVPTSTSQLRILNVENFTLNGRCTGRILINIPGGVTVTPNQFIRVEGVRGRIDSSLGIAPGTDLLVSLQSINDPAANQFNPDRVRASKAFDGLNVTISADTLELCQAPTGKLPGVEPSHSITVTEGFGRAFVDPAADRNTRVDDYGMPLGAPTNATMLDVLLEGIPGSVESITWPAQVDNAGAQSSLRLTSSDFNAGSGTASAVYSFHATDQTNMSDIYIESFVIRPAVVLKPGSAVTGNIFAAVSLGPPADNLADCTAPDPGVASPAFVRMWESDSISQNPPDDDPSAPLLSIVNCSCTYVLQPAMASFPSTGGSGSVSVVAADGCNWTAVSDDPWIKITSGAGGSGNGSVDYAVEPNVGPRREGTLTIGGQTFTVAQEAGCAAWETIDFKGADATYLYGINPRGDIAGVYTSGVDHGFVMSDGAVKTVDVQDPEILSTWAEGIAPQGTVAGTYRTPGVCVNCPDWITGDWHGFVWRAGRFEAFKVPNASYTYATGINARGDVVGEYMRDGKVYGFIRDGKGFTTIDVSESPDSLSWCAALGVNANGDVTGWFGNGRTMVFHGYALLKGRLVTLDGPGSTWTIGHGINARGEVVGWYYDTGGTQRGFLWSGGKLNTIDIPDAIWTGCEGINDHGDIVGSYGTGDGRIHGFVLYR